MPDPDGPITNRDLADEIINTRLFASTGFAIPDSPIHARTIRLSTSTGALGSSGVVATLVERRRIWLYTGDDSEDGPGGVFSGRAGSFSESTGFNEDRTLFTSIEAPAISDPSGAGAMSMTLFSEAVDDTRDPEMRIFYNGGSTRTPKANFVNTNVTAFHIFDTTNTNAANVVVTSTGGLRRFASALKYKPGWSYTTSLADRELPRPITWPTDTGGQRIGYGAEHVATYVPEAAAFEQYHLAGIVAVLQDKIERLETVVGLDE